MARVERMVIREREDVEDAERRGLGRRHDRRVGRARHRRVPVGHDALEVRERHVAGLEERRDPAQSLSGLGPVGEDVADGRDDEGRQPPVAAGSRAPTWTAGAAPAVRSAVSQPRSATPT